MTDLLNDLIAFFEARNTGNATNELLNRCKEARSEQCAINDVINWVVCKDVKPVDGKEYLISDGEDVTEAQWYDDSKWGGEPYDSYTHYAEKPKPPCL